LAIAVTAPASHLAPMATGDDQQDNKADPADWTTVKRFLPYLWPPGRRDLRARILIAVLFVILAMLVALALPFA
jgi:ATP-binding cassette subfamily B protein